MKFISNKNRPPAPVTKAPLADTSMAIGADFSIEAELDKCTEVLRREIRNLMSQSANGKLDASASRDLVNYIKLLHEMKLDQTERAANMTDEELLNISK